jgi:hypothetical protein
MDSAPALIDIIAEHIGNGYNGLWRQGEIAPNRHVVVLFAAPEARPIASFRQRLEMDEPTHQRG